MRSNSIIYTRLNQTNKDKISERVGETKEAKKGTHLRMRTTKVIERNDKTKRNME